MAVPWAQIGWRFATGVFLAWVSRQSDDSSPEGTQHRPIKTTVSETVGPGQIVLGTARVGARKVWASASDYTREYREALGRWNRTNNELLPVGTYRRVSATQIDLHGITADAASTGGRTIYDRLRALAPYGPERQEDRFTIWINGAKYTVTAADAVRGQVEVTRVSVTPNLADLPATINIDVGAEEKGRRAEFVYAISHGKCDGSLGKVWVNGDMHSVTDVVAAPGTADGKMYFVKDVVALGKRADLFIKSNDPTRRSDLIQIFSFSKADGKEAQVESDLYRYPESTPVQGPDGSTVVKDTGWGVKQKGYDISYLHVWIYQPAYSDDFNEANVKWQQYFDGEPEFEFEYKGRSFWWPGQADGVDQWTESAAAINYLIDTEYIDIPAQYINVESVEDAHDICSETLVNTSIPENWPARYKAPALRYSVNGVIRGSDTHERIRSELDFAWAGKRIAKNGEIHYRPGANRAPVATIDKNNSTPRGQIAMSPPLDIRLNSATVTLAQSALDDFRTVVLPEIKDQPAIDNDGETFHRDLGTRLFVNNPVTAARLTTIWLRLARDVRRFPRRTQPGPYGKNYGISVTDRVLLDVVDDRVGPDFPGAGTCVVESRTIEGDGGIVLNLGELQNIYDDSGVVPPVLGPDALFRGVDLGYPTGIGAREESLIQKDGFTFSNVIIFWDLTPQPIVELWHRMFVPAGTQVTVFEDGNTRRIDGPYYGHWQVEQVRNKNSFTIPAAPVGVVIEYKARTVSSSRLKSAFSPTHSIVVTGDDQAPANPSSVSYEALSGDFRLNYDIPVDSDYSLTRIRGIKATVADSDPPDNAPLIWAGRGGTGGVYTLPGSNNNAAVGTIWIAHEDLSGNLSKWYRLEVHQLPPDDREEWVDIVWRLGDSDTAPPATPTDPYDDDYPRIPPAFNGRNQYLWGWARRRPRGIEDADWSAFEPPVPWACGPTIEPSGRFTRQIRFQWRIRSVGGDYDGPHDGLPGEDSSTTLYPIVDIRVGYRGSLTSGWSAYGVWIPIEKLTARGARVYGVEARQSLSSPPLLPNLPTGITGGIDSSNVPVASWTNPSSGLPDVWLVVWHFRFTTRGINSQEIVSKKVSSTETSARAVSVDPDTGTRTTVSVEDFAGGTLTIYPVRNYQASEGVTLDKLSIPTAPVRLTRESVAPIPTGNTEPPTDLAVTVIDSNSARATWKLPSGTVWDSSSLRNLRGNVRIVGTSSWGSEISFAGDSVSAVLAGLAANTNYEFRIARWTTERGYSTYITAQFTTQASPKAPAPRNVTMITDGLSWDAPISGSPIGYEIRYVIRGQTFSNTVSSTTLRYQFGSRLSPEGTLSVRALYSTGIHSDWVSP